MDHPDDGMHVPPAEQRIRMLDERIDELCADRLRLLDRLDEERWSKTLAIAVAISLAVMLGALSIFGG